MQSGQGCFMLFLVSTIQAFDLSKNTSISQTCPSRVFSYLSIRRLKIMWNISFVAQFETSYLVNLVRWSEDRFRTVLSGCGGNLCCAAHEPSNRHHGKLLVHLVAKGSLASSFERNNTKVPESWGYPNSWMAYDGNSYYNGWEMGIPPFLGNLHTGSSTGTKPICRILSWISSMSRGYWIWNIPTRLPGKSMGWWSLDGVSTESKTTCNMHTAHHSSEFSVHGRCALCT